MTDPTRTDREEIVSETNPTTGKQGYTKVQRTRINTPRLEIDVTADVIARSVRAESRTCMVAESIKANHSWAANVHVDWAEIRLTDPKKNLRYVYRTPRKAAEAILAFDQGLDVEPFKVKTTQALQVVRYGAMKKAAGGEVAKPIGDVEAQRRYSKKRNEQRAAALEQDENGQVQSNPEYLAGLAERLNDPKADLGPATPMLDAQSANHGLPVMVGGSTRPTSARIGKPGQLKFTRRFGAREFWRGDGSGREGIIKAREEGKAFRDEHE